jgi:hypothetical protein
MAALEMVYAIEKEYVFVTMDTMVKIAASKYIR